METAAPTQEATSGTVSRALQLLALIADAGGTVSVKQIAEQMRLAPSTAHRLLNLLKKEGFVDSAVEGRQYVIGAQFYRVAARVVNAVSPRDIAQPVIESIANAFSETVLFGVYQAAQHALHFAARADGQQKLKYEIAMNQPLSLVWGASGKAILAFLSPDVIRTIIDLEGPSPANGATLPPISELELELAEIRERGYAVSDGEKLPDARGIAAPVFGPKGVIGCICLTSPKARMPHADIHAIGVEICARAEALSRDLGAPST
ncbi:MULTISPECIES: IclR family transcriptional regulator [Paraburkholderia]|uniref:IclR family transcriptional regulator n=1 Tax=Paraburkholderia TaxID=1822464 RepID=UPI00037A69EA|nr:MULTISPECIES: IclR family transcriptional regulator [Paraburkholderia]